MTAFLLWNVIFKNTFVGLVYLIILAINIFTVLYMLFVDKRNPQKILLWVISIICFPVVGFVFFLFLGKGPNIGKRKKFLSKALSDERYRRELYHQSVFFQNVDRIQDQDILGLLQYNILQNKSICTYENDATIYTDIEKQYDDMYRDIENAKSTVNFQYFIIKPDASGVRFRDLLIQKAKEGVKVKVIYDDFGSIKMHMRFFRGLKRAGGEIYRFMPSLLRFFGRNMNYRNHRKMVIIDGKIAYTGGANIGNEYISKHKRITPWRDTQVRLTGRCVDLVNMNFMQDFNFVSGKDEIAEPQQTVETENLLPVQIIADGPDNSFDGIEDVYAKAIYSAKKSVLIQTPYFVPTTVIMEALKTAAKSGVDVQIMIPLVPDKPIPYNCTISYITELLPFGVKIYRWKGFIHSKTMLIDGKVSSIGTVNIDYRSFNLHFELTAFLYGETFGKQMADIFEQDKENSVLYTSEDVAKKKFTNKFWERIMRLLSPLM